MTLKSESEGKKRGKIELSSDKKLSNDKSYLVKTLSGCDHIILLDIRVGIITLVRSNQICRLAKVDFKPVQGSHLFYFEI